MGLGDRVVGNVGSVGNCEVGVAISVGPVSWLRANINAPIINSAATAMLATTSISPVTTTAGVHLRRNVGGWPARGSGAVCQPRPSQYSVPSLPLGSGYQPGASGARRQRLRAFRVRSGFDRRRRGWRCRRRRFSPSASLLAKCTGKIAAGRESIGGVFRQPSGQHVIERREFGSGIGQQPGVPC